jgi:Predicted integral membrane protein
MAEERVNRKLVAILAADVVGYSRLMGADEAGTLAALKQHRQTIFDPAVAAHNGRIVKLIGGGTIVEFGSVIDAVNSALSVQRSDDPPPDEVLRQPKIVLRIGINLGDVIIEGDDIYGDGVNIAARLEPLAEPGGICVSSIVNESIGNRIDVRFQDAGDITVKNINRPIRIWKWHPGATPDVTRSKMDKPLPKVATASIAVLPFTNMSGDPEQEYFSDGISDDIITDLSKIAGLTVIARNSSFTYKGRSVDIRTVGRELGVQSVLEGSIRRAGKRVRIAAQLIDTTNGGHLWADRYDRDLTDIFEVQDDVTHRIVDALKITLSPAEKERLADTETSKTSNVVAYDCVLRGREFMLGKEKNLETFRTSDQVLQAGAGTRSQLFGGLCLPGLRLHVRLPKPLDRESRRLVADRQGIRPAGYRKGPERTAGAMRIRIGGVVRKGSRSRQDRDRCGPSAEPESGFGAQFARQHSRLFWRAAGRHPGD